jgi:exodeoxyribonuclease VII large subunit
VPHELFDPIRGPAPRAHGAGGAGDRTVFTVGQITARVKLAVEQIGAVWVGGEVSNLSVPTSGHMYFSLKDGSAQLSAVIWRGVAARLRFRPKDGDELLVFGRLSVYEPRGQYQIIVERAEPKGLGALQRAFEELKVRLAAEGLFDSARKRPIPLLPRAIAIVTSPTGAAIHDMLEVIWGRFPSAHVVLCPVRVQGAGAAGEIASAIELVNRWGGADVLIVGRGGGSIEDLWAFNEEVVARAIYASAVPVVSAVGHEVDVSISDFVADERALTPSAAGMRVVPRKAELESKLAVNAGRLFRAMSTRVSSARERVHLLERSYGMHVPWEAHARERQRVDELAAKLGAECARPLSAARESLAKLAGHLEGLSPLGALARGYSVACVAGTRAAVRDAAALAPGMRLTTRFAAGEADSTVDEVRGSPVAPRGGE